MNVSSIPDAVGMLIVVAILLWLRRAPRNHHVWPWGAGVGFLMLAAAAGLVGQRGTGFAIWANVIALCCYVLAGVSFGWAARHDVLPGTRHVPFVVLPAAPLLIVAGMYGAGLQSRPAYATVAACSLLLAFAYLAVASRGRPRLQTIFFTLHAGMWLPILIVSLRAPLRWMVPTGLACLYLLVGVSLRRFIRRDGIGGLVIAAGFTVWSAAFLIQPLTRAKPVLAAVVGDVGTMEKFVVVLGMLLVLLEDESRRRQDEAMHDALTGLPNRRLFDDRLRQALERTRRTGRSTALFALDLNNFKAINDSLGHAIGDSVLQTAAKCLEASVRSSDTLARCGGDEFWLIVSDLDRVEDCDRIAASLRRALIAQVIPEAPWITLSASVGYALFPEEHTDATSLCEAADARMYQAKRGKSRLLATA